MKKTAVVTGATGGLGWELALQLARQGYRLVLPCRSLEKAEALRNAIGLQVQGAELDFLPCDLADLSAVARCGALIASRHPVIDVVVANAATVSPRRCLSPQGVERTFSVNYLAHVVLLHWLLDNLYTHSRVVLVSSSGIRWGQGGCVEGVAYGRRPYGMFRAYANSKMALTAWGIDLAAGLAARQIGCMMVHPGMLDTGIWSGAGPLARGLLPVFRKLCLKPAGQGAAVVAHFATAPEHCETRGFFHETRPAALPRSINPAFRARLLAVTAGVCREYLPTRPA